MCIPRIGHWAWCQPDTHCRKLAVITIPFKFVELLFRSVRILSPSLFSYIINRNGLHVYILECIFFGPFTANLVNFMGPTSMCNLVVDTGQKPHHHRRLPWVLHNEPTLSICNNVVARNEALPFLIDQPSPPPPTRSSASKGNKKPAGVQHKIYYHKVVVVRGKEKDMWGTCAVQVSFGNALCPLPFA